jgi:hypothetical protein
LKIAIIAPSNVGGGRVRAMAYKNFLQSKNYCVDTLSYDEIWQSRIGFFFQRAMAHALWRLSPHKLRFIKKTADLLESKIKSGKYDVVIGVESHLSYVFTRDLSCLKIFSWEAMTDELYFNPRRKKDSELEGIRRFREMEFEICKHSDYVVFPWETSENYVRKHFWDGSNFLTIRYGCYPQSKPVSFSFPPAIVSIGYLNGYWVNKELLSYLTSISPYILNVYGKPRPERKYKLNYKGFASSLDVLYDYQFGLNTVSKDIYRRNHFSSRPLGYIAYGLPVLSPDWMKFSHEIRGCLPYNEDNFVDLIDQYSEKSAWEKLSREAHEQARELDWNVTLKPLEKIISK